MSDAVTRLNAALEGRYAIERELGEGGMATVYLADDLKHERKVALKVLKPVLAADGEAGIAYTRRTVEAAVEVPRVDAHAVKAMADDRAVRWLDGTDHPTPTRVVETATPRSFRG